MVTRLTSPLAKLGDYARKLPEQDFMEDARPTPLLAALADGKTIFYIDINELFDDENGNLRADASGDSTHVYAKYDLDWCDWLCTKAIVR